MNDFAQDFFSESMVSFCILSRMAQKPEQYNYKTKNGRSAVRRLSENFLDMIKSKNGAYDQIGFVGFCLRSRLFDRHAQELLSNNEETMGHLMTLYSAVITQLKKPMNLSVNHKKADVDEAGLAGLTDGIKLAKKVLMVAMAQNKELVTLSDYMDCLMMVNARRVRKSRVVSPSSKSRSSRVRQ